MTEVRDHSYRSDARPSAQPRFVLSTGARVLLAVLSAGAGIIHLAMVPSHWQESVVEGVGFAVTGWVQLALGVALLARPTALLVRAAVVANLVFVAVWAISRAFGLPFGEHAWHPHDPAFIDLACVGIEVALIVAGGAVLLRPGLGRDWSHARLAIGAIVPIAVMALATAALASPSARDHADAAHGAHGHGDDATAAAHRHPEAVAADDKGLGMLQNGHQHARGEVELDNATQAALSTQLAQTAKLVERYPTIAAAEAAGYRRSGPFVPGLGTHYTSFKSEDILMGAEGPMVPTLIFDGIESDAPIAGFMYMSYGARGEPEGFVGPNDHWHYHTNTCVVFKDGVIEAPLGSDTGDVSQEECSRYGGRLIANTGYMVHVWTVPGYESSRGVFSEVNPKLTCPDGSYRMLPREKWAFRPNVCRQPNAQTVRADVPT